MRAKDFTPDQWRQIANALLLAKYTSAGLKKAAGFTLSDDEAFRLSASAYTEALHAEDAIAQSGTEPAK